MLYVLYGEDDFSMAQELRRLEAAVGAPDALDANRHRLSGQGLTLSALQGACNAMPFLGDRRLVIVEGLLPPASRRRAGRSRAPSEPEEDPSQPDEAQPAGKWDGLPDYVPQMPPTTDLVLITRGRPEPAGLLRKLQDLVRSRPDVARVREFPAMRREELMRWVRDRAMVKKATLDPRAVTLLVDLIGSNLWTLDAEIEKLSLYTNGETVQPEHVRLLVAQAHEESIFNAVDAALEGKVGLAAPQMERLLLSGAQFPYLVSMLERQLRLTVQVKALLDRREPEEAIGEKVGLHGYPLRKTVDQARRAPWPRLRAAYAKLAEADLAVKRGRFSPPVALSVLLAELGPVR